jgi:hypoxanthine phosphoribosyltransferase
LSKNTTQSDLPPSEYSQGVCEDGAAILKNGQMLTVDEIVDTLNSLSYAIRLAKDPLKDYLDYGQGFRSTAINAIKRIEELGL